MIRHALFAVLLLAPGLAAAQTPSPPADVPAYRPHRAVYDIVLAPSRQPQGQNRARIEQARGRLVYEFQGSACEGYTTTLRFVTELQLGEGQAHMTDIRSTTTEAGDGSEFRFVSRSFVNGTERDHSDGIARRQADGTIRVELRRPQTLAFTLPASMLFPTQHMTGALAAARAGRLVFEADIYDGSEGGQKSFYTTGVMRRATADIPAGHPAAAHLAGQRRFPMTFSFFERVTGQAQTDQTPLYELSVEVYESGITHAIFIDYGDFALRGTMASLEMLPVTPCN